ncbi:hypothetical protein M0Q28_00775 [Patescibacteria group bacterium]|nr:hypothetical protein [Patescibacteria group bacterium]
MSFRNLTQRAVSILALAGLALPSVAAAQTLNVNANVRAPGLNAEVRADVCSKIGTHFLDVESKLVDLRVKLDARSNDREQKLEERRADRLEKVSDREKQSDERRAELATKLEAHATTDAQRAAILKFQADVRAAVEARRVAYQAANEAFRRGVDASVTARRTQVEASVTLFRTSVKAALEKAKTDCAAGVSAATVKANLLAALKAARTRFESDRKAIDRVGTQVKALAETRKAAHAKAMTVFKADMEKARVALKAAFAGDVK